MTRRGVGDEAWQLAVQGDVPALERAGELLLADGDGLLAYDGHRALAFARALEGRVDDALEELNEGWTADWPFPAAYAADVARIRFLVGDHGHSVAALRLAARSADRLDPALPELAAACARRDRSTRPAAVRVALAAGTPWQRLRNAVAVLRA